MTIRDLGGASATHLQRNEQKWWYFVRIDVPTVGPQYFTDHPHGDQVLNIDGAVGSTAITAPGSGYTTATVTFGAPNLPGGTQATGTVNLSGGQVVSITLVQVGSGYTANPTVTISGDGADAGSFPAGVRRRDSSTRSGSGFTRRSPARRASRSTQ